MSCKKASKKKKNPPNRSQTLARQPNVVPHSLTIPLSKEMFCHKQRVKRTSYGIFNNIGGGEGAISLSILFFNNSADFFKGLHI